MNNIDSVIKDNTELFINRTLYEKALKQQIEVEGIPKVIENKNYYSITKEQLDQLNNSIKPKKNNYIICYVDKNNNKYYVKEEDLDTKKDNPKTIMGKTCYEVSEEELKNLGDKIVKVSVYLKQKNLININITSLDSIYIEDKYVQDKQNKKQIRIDGVLYTAVTELELAKLKQELTKEGNEVSFKQRKVIKKNKELNDMFNNPIETEKEKNK